MKLDSYKYLTWVVDGQRIETALGAHDAVPMWHGGQWVLIDADIADVIAEFWANDIDTYASCQGDPADMPSGMVDVMVSRKGGRWEGLSRYGGAPAYCMVLESRRSDAEALLKSRGYSIVESRFSRDEWGIIRWRTDD